MNLSDYRERLDRIDTELLRLFSERMEIASEIGLYKKQNALPLLDRAREEEKLAKELPEFVRTARIEATSVPVETNRKDDSKKQDTKKRPMMKGSSSDIRSMGGPRRR